MFVKSKTYVSLCRGEDDFLFSPDGISLVPRAEIVISEQCPTHIRDMVDLAFRKGWVAPIANMRETEYTLELLQK